MANDFVEAMADFRTERPITHTLAIPLGLKDPSATTSDVGLILNRAITGILSSACQCNLVPAYVGAPRVLTADPLSHLYTLAVQARDARTSADRRAALDALERAALALGGTP